MGSSDTSCIALSGRGCSDISVCSKRGREAAAGRGACIVDHRSTLLGACGGGASRGGRFCNGVGEGTEVPVCGGGEGVDCVTPVRTSCLRAAVTGREVRDNIGVWVQVAFRLGLAPHSTFTRMDG
jgi:hypothetical protein